MVRTKYDSDWKEFAKFIDFDKKLRFISMYAIKTTLVILLIIISIWTIMDLFNDPDPRLWSFKFMGYFFSLYFIIILIYLIQRKIRHFRMHGGEFKEESRRRIQWW